jgi:hypothetical protein
MAYVFNPFTGNLDWTDAATGGAATIQQLDADPGAPAAEDAWVLRTVAGSHADGEGMGVLGLTYTGDVGSSSYQFSYRTAQATTIRVTMT